MRHEKKGRNKEGKKKKKVKWERPCGHVAMQLAGRWRCAAQFTYKADRCVRSLVSRPATSQGRGPPWRTSRNNGKAVTIVDGVVDAKRLIDGTF